MTDKPPIPGPGPQAYADVFAALDLGRDGSGDSQHDAWPPPPSLDLPFPPDGEKRRMSFPGRILLRVINIDPDWVRYEERTKFYLMASLVVTNAGVAAIAFAVGLSASYHGLSTWEATALGVLAGFIIGGIDALVVGTWTTYKACASQPFWRRRSTSPPSEGTDGTLLPLDPPLLPGAKSRLAIQVGRVALTVTIAVSAGLMTEIASNAPEIKSAEAAAALGSQKLAQQVALSGLNISLADYEKSLADARKRLNSDTDTLNYDIERAQCERYGTPRVANCSLHPYPGPLYSFYLNKANGPDKVAVNADNTRVSALQGQIQTAENEIAALSEPDSPQAKNPSPATRATLERIAQAGEVPTGLSSAISSLHAYAAQHHWSWLTQNLLSLLIGGLDLLPAGWKLLAGTTLYEVDRWRAGYDEALQAAERRRAWLAALRANRQLSQIVATASVSQKVAHLAAVLRRLPATSSTLPADPAQADSNLPGQGGGFSHAQAPMRVEVAEQESAEAQMPPDEAHDIADQAPDREQQVLQRLSEFEVKANRDSASLARAEAQLAEARLRIALERERREAAEQQLDAAVSRYGTGFHFHRDLLDKAGFGGHVYAVSPKNHPDQLKVLKIIGHIGSTHSNDHFDSKHQMRLLREIARLKPLNHPNIVPIEAVYWQDNFLGMLMPYYRSGDLAVFLATADVLPISQILAWGGDVADALVYLTSLPAPIVHRDIKPHNLFRSDTGALILGDFGLAKFVENEPIDATGSANFVGSHRYAAPEQFMYPDAVDTKADIRALGAVLYKMCTGWPPLVREFDQARGKIEFLKALIDPSWKPTPPSSICPVVQPRLSDLIMRMLTFDPAERPSASEVRRELSDMIETVDEGQAVPLRQLRERAGAPATRPPSQGGDHLSRRLARKMPPHTPESAESADDVRTDDTDTALPINRPMRHSPLEENEANSSDSAGEIVQAV